MIEHFGDSKKELIQLDRFDYQLEEVREVAGRIKVGNQTIPVYLSSNSTLKDSQNGIRLIQLVEPLAIEDFDLETISQLFALQPPNHCNDENQRMPINPFENVYESKFMTLCVDSLGSKLDFLVKGEFTNNR